MDKQGKFVNVNVNHFGANSCVCACVCSCVHGSAHGNGCVVNGGSATAAIIIIIAYQFVHKAWTPLVRTFGAKESVLISEVSINTQIWYFI